ncbi:hypothetical protein [Gloeothece verrucosa]|uniref:hypothetical protein n=1 Tax=Gloeothece verrucosa TaxID=2546359 RepID=UPI0002FE6386|nr:hypothetical protein [Gloeothece verrucosa]
MPLTRQVRHYQKSRDNWKENAALKQRTLRSYLQLTRSLKKSRDNWKLRAKQAEARVKELEKKLSSIDPQNASESASHSSKAIDDETIPGHHYSLTTVSVVVRQIIKVGNSYRGVAKTMELVSSHSSFGTPHYSSIKTWIERIGLYELQRPKEKRSDWLFIADLTLELGKSKALVIYGIPNRYWQRYRLRHPNSSLPTDGQILALEVTDEATGDWIYGVLQSVSQQVGTPLQIISDRASNLYKGIQLFRAYHPGVIYTYDVTHAMANLLKKQLIFDEDFQNFLADCHQCKLQLQQTELAFAAPPPQRTQCRYFNLERLVNWASHILKSDLTLFSQLLPNLPLYKLQARLEDKLGWLKTYLEPIKIWKHLLFLTRTLEKQLKFFGLNPGSISSFSDRLSHRKIPDFLQPFQQRIFSYLEEQVYFK